MSGTHQVGRDLNDDDSLLAILSEALDEAATVPEAARRAALAAFDLGHLEGELARVVADSAVDAPLVGARHDAPVDLVDDRFVDIESDHLRVEVELSSADGLVIGQIVSPDADRVTIEFWTAGGGIERVDAPVDELGRFQEPMRPGNMRFHLATPAGPVVTPWIVR